MIAALLPIIPWHTYVDYLDVLRIRGDKTAIHLTNQSLTALIERFFYPPVLFLNWTGEQAVTVMPAIRGANLAAETASANQPEPIAVVTLATAEPRQHREATTAIGTVLALQSITLRNELAGTVRQVSLTPGQVVEAGKIGRAHV